jgi:hypothetical protein
MRSTSRYTRHGFEDFVMQTYPTMGTVLKWEHKGRALVVYTTDSHAQNAVECLAVRAGLSALPTFDKDVYSVTLRGFMLDRAPRRRRAATHLAMFAILAALATGCGEVVPASYTVNYQCQNGTGPTLPTVQTVTVVATGIESAKFRAEQPVQVACGSTFDGDYRFGSIVRGDEQPVQKAEAR